MTAAVKFKHGHKVRKFKDFYISCLCSPTIVSTCIVRVETPSSCASSFVVICRLIIRMLIISILRFIVFMLHLLSCNPSGLNFCFCHKDFFPKKHCKRRPRKNLAYCKKLFYDFFARLLPAYPHLLSDVLSLFLRLTFPHLPAKIFSG